MTNDLVKYGLYRCIDAKLFPINSEQRIIWSSKDEDLVTLIRANEKKLKKPKTLPYSIVLNKVNEKNGLN